MSEFKKVGVSYVSEWNGNSLNPGTNLSPYAHPADAPSSENVIIVGAGYYKGIWAGSSRVCHADGTAILDCLGGILPTRTGSNLSTRHTDMIFKNGRFLVSGQSTFFRCTFIDFDGTNSFTTYTNCLFLGNDHTFTGDSSQTFNNCLILISIQKINALNYSFIQSGKTIIYSGTSANLNNNLINGKVKISGIDYELKFLIDGSPRPDADPLIPDLATLYADTYTTRRNFAGDPKFLDQLNKIVDSDSDLLKRSNANGFIGGVRPGKKIAVNSSDPDITITTTDIDTTDSQNWIIQSLATEGFINIIWKISDNISEVQRIFFDALLQFDGSEASGSVGNNNVPDNFPASYSPLSQDGLTPNRLLYEFRTSQSIAKPTTDAQWDNDNVALGTTAGDFYLQEWNTKPTITTILGVAYGNGNPESIGGSNNGINARWGHAKIRLTNNRAY